ncbi:MAG TPA: hypothetical protein VK504_09955 [Vicinamibacterales bacterium]|nr:hypothetical protein [Vicinamibacterales bacterium]
MPTTSFEPKFMKVGVLTAALQELTPRAVRDPDPDRAIEEWVAFARELNAGYIQLSAALHPTFMNFGSNDVVGMRNILH